MEKRTIDWLLEHLPTEPGEGLLPWALETQEEELGGDYLIFHNERLRGAPTMYQLLEENSIIGKSEWWTNCACTACGSEFYTRKGTTRRSFLLLEGEDGEIYPIGPGGEEDPALPGIGNTVEYMEGDHLLCPYCEMDLRVIHRDTVRGGRTKQIQIAEMRNVGRFTTILYWLVAKTVSEHGVTHSTHPRFAYVLGDRGELVAFSHRRPGVYDKDRADNHWHQLATNHDRWDARYHDWGSANDTKCGSDAFGTLPAEADMEGTTGEKTGLRRYWEDTDGCYPVEYLKIWQKKKNVENLVNAGFSSMCREAIRAGLRAGNSPWAALAEAVDLNQKRPSAMLGVSRAELKQIRTATDPYGLLKAWKKYRAAGGAEDIGTITSAYETAGQYAVHTAIELIRRWGDCDIGKLQRYMIKQKTTLREIGLLRDSRDMAKELAGDRALTEEELWPRHLQQAHDRLDAMRVAVINKKESQRLQGGFDRVLETYRDIQWNDGHLAVILPESNEELILEGKVLRHCVGGYGSEHAEGKNIILFVRHYRRPERSYYTLNISFAGETPTEIQLHGYGNERHGAHKQYRHSIPKEVRAFVDRWEEEVLAPWWRQHRKEIEKETKTA